MADAKDFNAIKPISMPFQAYERDYVPIGNYNVSHKLLTFGASADVYRATNR